MEENRKKAAAEAAVSDEKAAGRHPSERAKAPKEYTADIVQGDIHEFFEDSAEYKHPEDHLSRFEHICLTVRNILAGTAALLFIASILPLHLGVSHHTLQAVAYFFGAGAYIAEIVEMSDEEKRASKDHRKHVFMPNLFGLLYIILGISHLFD